MARQMNTPDNSAGLLSLIQIKPLFISLSVTLISLSVLALCIAFGPVSEKVIDASVLLITVFSIFLSGLLSARNKATKGYLSGCVSGLLYVLSAYFMSALAFGCFSPGKSLLKLFFMGVGVGALGGIVGINIRRKKY